MRVASIGTPCRRSAVRDLGALHSVSASTCACDQHTCDVSLSIHSVMGKLSGAS
jgi:hypothetical protein